MAELRFTWEGREVEANIDEDFELEVTAALINIGPYKSSVSSVGMCCIADSCGCQFKAARALSHVVMDD